MKFIWLMTEENWKNLMHDMNASDYDELSKDYDFYGQMYCGDYCVEFIVDSTETEMISFTNVYQLFIDSGYNHTRNGIPYDFIDGYIEIPKVNSFEEFKSICEKEFINKVNKGIDFKIEYADKKCEWEQVNELWTEIV